MIAEKTVEELINLMSQISKSDCIALDEAMQVVGVSKGTFYTYLNYLNIQRHKFPFDRRAYILRSDLTRIQEFIEENKK